MTYGTIVAQLCQDYDGNYQEVNKQLEKMGYNIGMRLIEDFLAKSNVGRCANFRETADMISKVELITSISLGRLGINELTPGMCDRSDFGYSSISPPL